MHSQEQGGRGGGEVYLPEGRAPCPAQSVHGLQLWPLQGLPPSRELPPEAQAFPGQPPSGSSATWPGEAEPFGPLRDL